MLEWTRKAFRKNKKYLNLKFVYMYVYEPGDYGRVMNLSTGDLTEEKRKTRTKVLFGSVEMKYVIRPEMVIGQFKTQV